MSELKVGMRVKVVKSIFNPDDQAIGCTGTIITIDSPDAEQPYRVVLDEPPEDYRDEPETWFEAEELEPIEE